VRLGPNQHSMKWVTSLVLREFRAGRAAWLRQPAGGDGQVGAGLWHNAPRLDIRCLGAERLAALLGNVKSPPFRRSLPQFDVLMDAGDSFLSLAIHGTSPQ